MKLWEKIVFLKLRKKKSKKKNLYFYHLKVNNHLKYGTQSHYSYLL